MGAVVGDGRRSPRGGGKLTCAEQDDNGADVEPSHDTVGARPGAMYKAKEPQDGGTVVHKFEEVAAIGTLEFVP